MISRISSGLLSKALKPTIQSKMPLVLNQIARCQLKTISNIYSSPSKPLQSRSLSIGMCTKVVLSSVYFPADEELSKLNMTELKELIDNMHIIRSKLLTETLFRRYNFFENRKFKNFSNETLDSLYSSQITEIFNMYKIQELLKSEVSEFIKTAVLEKISNGQDKIFYSRSKDFHVKVLGFKTIKNLNLNQLKDKLTECQDLQLQIYTEREVRKLNFDLPENRKFSHLSDEDLNTLDSKVLNYIVKLYEIKQFFEKFS